MRLEPGSRLGPYEIIGPIGAGGMGEVYRARDTRLGREVAIKILPRDVSRDPERLARFEREARSASALNHRNIVTIHDFTSGDGETWLVMELIHGDSLRAIGARGPLSLKRLLPIAAGVAEGLAAAHAAGIVHRDLKPENVMLTADGTPKILDFGLVKRALSNDDASSPTDMQVSRSGAVMGTARYMSPEQARGEAVDFRTDQFSLGLMLHEMASGKHPFGRPMGVETLSAILNEDAEPLGNEFPEQFTAIVERCLAKNPSERYGSTSDLAHDLARLRDRSGPHVTVSRRKPTASRWPAALFAAAGIAAILALLLVLVTWRQRSTATGDAVHANVATPELASVYLGEAMPSVALSPDGRYLVVYGADSDGKLVLSLHDLRSGTARVLAEQVFSGAWSSDSKAVAYFADGKLKTVSVDGGPPRTVCDARPEATPSWQGDTILFWQFSKDPGIYRVSAAGGAPQRIIAGSFAPDDVHVPWWPEFLPDGARFLYVEITRARDEKTVHHNVMIASLDGASTRKVSSTIDSRVVFAGGQLLYVRDGTLLAQPFDPDKGQFTRAAKPVVDGLYYFRGTACAAFTASQNGLLAWREAARSSRLGWLDRNGIEVGSIGTAQFAGGRLSPDGNRYCVGIVDPKNGSSDIWVYDLTRESSERLTYSLLDEKEPVWSPDGRTIYYRADFKGPPDIYQMRLGEDHGTLLFGGPGVQEPQDVSADGKWLLFVAYSTVGSDIAVLPLAPPGPPRPFVATPFTELFPRFSPDGRWVSYTSDISGRPEVYVKPFEGSEQTIRISKDGGTRARWRRDGKELFFLGLGGRLMVSAVGANMTLGTPRMLFQAADAVDFEPA
ncbi:MAG: protein kinase domain-containing protein, partial [Thermoanaerobaculia bacterium]